MTKTGQTKDNMKKDGRERKGKSWMEELERGTNRSGGWRDNVEAFCAARHEEDR